MEESISIFTLKTFVEQKLGKKVLVKMIWNETEKITLFIHPKMKVNSFIYDDREGYLFYDLKGNLIKEPIACVIPEKYLIDGKVAFAGLTDGKILVNGEKITKKEVYSLNK